MKCGRTQRLTALLFLIFLLVDIGYGGLPCCDDCIQTLPAGTSIVMTGETHGSEAPGEKCLCCSPVILTNSLSFVYPTPSSEDFDAEDHQVPSGSPENLYHPPRTA
jgi:hypothetical protein